MLNVVIAECLGPTTAKGPTYSLRLIYIHVFIVRLCIAFFTNRKLALAFENAWVRREQRQVRFQRL
jgi:hypothetical protein